MNNRSLSLDIGKGLLVLVMLVHHAWSAIHLAGANDSMRGVVSFVSSAFILYSGYLLGLILLAGYLRTPGVRMRRDLARGLRLMLIFLGANLLLHLVTYDGIPARIGLSAWLLACFGPNPPPSALFSLLNAFAWFFFGSSLLFYLVIRFFAGWGKTSSKIILMIATPAVFVLIYPGFGIGSRSMFASVTIYGFVGIWFGILASFLVPRFLPLMGSLGWIALAAYLLLSGMCLGGAFEPYRWYNSFVIIGSLAVWKTSDLIAGRPVGFLSRSLAYLGTYTLYAYLIQVVVGKVIDRHLTQVYQWAPTQWTAFVLALLGMGIIMVGSIKITDMMRRRVALVDYGYRLVFG